MKRFFLVTLLLITLSANAQIGTSHEDLYPSLKSKTLYIAVSDTTWSSAKEMMQAIRSAWTVSNISFVSPKEINSFYKPGNFFVTLDRSSRSFHFIRESLAEPNRMTKSKEIHNDYFYLNFWTLDDKHNAGNTPSEKDKIMLARAEMYLKSIGTGSIDFSNPDLGSIILGLEFCNGLPGYIKNIFQAVNSYITNNVAVKLKKDIDATPALAKLQTDTLYVPNYWYGPGGTMLPRETDNSANGKYIRKMMSEYPFPIRLIRRDELSDLILDASKPVYYFNYVQSSADKMISVVNGATGEILFYNFNGKSYRPKPSDFDDLGDAVRTAK